MMVAAGSLVGIDRVCFFPTLLCATAGSVGGFLVMYKAGAWFGIKVIEAGRIRYLPIESIRKVEAWFGRYGYWVVVANRFLTGTRAVVSFFAGMSGLRLGLTTVLCTVSALIWNAILVAGGYYLGRNWERIGFYLNTYSQVVTTIVVLLVLVLTARYLMKRNQKSTARAPVAEGHPRQPREHPHPAKRKGKAGGRFRRPRRGTHE